MSARLLIVEDEDLLARSLQRALERDGHEVALAATGEAGLETLGRLDADLVLLDQLLPGMSGLEVLEAIRGRGQGVPVIVMSAHGAVRSAVDAMRLGAYDYLSKPLDLDEVRLLIGRALDHARLSRELAYFRDRDGGAAPSCALLGSCPAMVEVGRRVERIARVERQCGGGPPVLVIGETGTGKSLVARAIHRAGPRGCGPFIEIRCGARGDAELFGRGPEMPADARRSRHPLLAAADGGTLFLDEVGRLDPPGQTRLLEILEESGPGPRGGTRRPGLDVRIIAATSRDLAAAESSGAFLPELLHRLRVLTVELPPLRERGGDVILLAEHFAQQHAGQYGQAPRPLSPAAREILLRYPWPGNVRELGNEIERAVLLETGEAITLEHLRGSLPVARTGAGIRPREGDVAVDLPSEGMAFELIERRVLERALDLVEWNVTQAARLLCLSRDTLRYRIERLGITPRKG